MKFYSRNKKIIETFLLCLALSACIVYLYIQKNSNQKNNTSIKSSKKSIVSAEDTEGRLQWEFNRQQDPLTGTIPDNIRREELTFAKSLPSDALYKSLGVQWTKRGPYFVGGRTRGLAIDIDNENRLIAGGVSGGIWISEDNGKTWKQQSNPWQLSNVTCLSQDIRPGKRNNWYYGTGELLGSSASHRGAYFLGNGLYKSTDNGLTWSSLTSTASNTPHNFDKTWDFVWNIAIDYSNTTSDIIYAATLGTICRSADGGKTWKTVLGGGGITSSYSFYADVAVTSKAVVYATLGRESGNVSPSGIYRSTDGLKWYKITPDSFPKYFNRMIIGINPNDENEVYILGNTLNQGKLTNAFYNVKEWNTLWRYNYITGDGTGLNGQWTNLSNNIPANSTNVFNNFYAQGSYNLVIKVKPGNSDVVFIGGTNLYRSTDAFNSDKNTLQIGGYEISTTLPDFHFYKNHHPDQHNLLFSRSNPDVMYSTNDGGIFMTNNNNDNTIEWVSLNNGYNTTQPYTVAIDESSNSDEIVSGFQDNGNYFTNSADAKALWTMPLNGDGAFGAIVHNPDCYYMSAQNGYTVKLTLDNAGNRKDYVRIDPIKGKNYDFINPFELDPHNNNIMYMAGGRKLWRNDSLNSIPFRNTHDSISTGWYCFPDTLISPETAVAAIAVSKNPANIVYYGTNYKNVYRIDNANTNNSVRTKITGANFPTQGNNEGANVSCIALDPEDGNKLMVVYSNYNVYSLFYSENAGTSWKRVGGNLEPNISGAGPGPSCRWASILPINNQRIYFLGTSTGLYATDKLVDETDSTHTVWTQIGAVTIGNAVVDMVKTRASDGYIVVATHGNGLYSTHITSFQDFQNIFESSRKSYCKLSISPNPAQSNINLNILAFSSADASVLIYDKAGRICKSINKTIVKGKNTININTADLLNGYYICVINTKLYKLSKPFLVVK